MAGKKVISVELGVQSTRICEILVNGKKRTVINTCVFDTPEGAIEDGYIRNNDILAVSMKAAMQRALITSKEVIFSISSSKIANREVNMPFLADNKIQSFVQTNAKEYFPIEVEKYVITYKKLEDIVEDDAKKMRILVLAAPNDLIETYYDLAKTVGLQITAIDYAGNSSYQILRKQNYKGVNVFVQLNENNTLINIMRGNVLMLQRTVPYGVSSIVDAAINCGEFDIVDKTSAYEKLFSDTLVNPRLNESAIDDVALSYMDSNNDAYSQQIRQMKAKDEITDAFSYLVNNSIRVLDYYASKFPDKKIDNIYLAGLGSRIKGILPLFKNEVFGDMKKMDNIVGIEFAKTINISNEEKSEYMVPLGAHIEPVDFVPQQYAQELLDNKYDKNFKLIILVGVAICAALLIIPAVLLGKQTLKKKSLENEIKKYDDVKKLVADLAEADVIYTNASNLSARTLGFGYVLKIFFEELESNLPKPTFITDFNFNAEGVNLSLKSLKIEEVAQLAHNMKKCALVDSVVINEVSTAEEQGVTYYSYDAEVKIKELDYSAFIDKSNVPSEKTIRKLLGINENEDSDEAQESETNVSDEVSQPDGAGTTNDVETNTNTDTQTNANTNTQTSTNVNTDTQTNADTDTNTNTNTNTETDTASTP